MKRATGIGGIFFRCQDKHETAAWYAKHLGLAVEDWGGAVFRWSEAATPERPGSTVWSPFASDTQYFGDSGQQFMLNLRVDDLDALLTALREEGVEVLEAREVSEFGRFGWIVDCDGRRVELWEPPPGA
jgi:predicted enzyme related to lactoylglutathione lyase